VPYREALALQRSLREARLAEGIDDTLLLLEHPPVITVTRRFGRANVLVSDDELRARGVEIVEADRGGDVTAHAPGQLVAYPIVKLVGAERDLPAYVRRLEEAVLRTLARWGLHGQRVCGEAGVFLDGTPLQKVCAIGVKGSRFVMIHGLALNVTTDLRVFDLIVPCGLRHRGVTSMEARLAERTPPLKDVADALGEELADALGRRAIAA
jgi:lipoyl(octanoyl) transferase